MQIISLNFTEHNSPRFHAYFPNIISMTVKHMLMILTSRVQLLEICFHTKKSFNQRLSARDRDCIL